MAIRNPNENESIKDYDELQSAYVNDLDERVKTEFDLRVDYPIDSNDNYVKWASGRLEQWGTINLNGLIENVVGASYNFAIVKPITPITTNSIVVTPLLYDANGGNFIDYLSEISLTTPLNGVYKIIKTQGQGADISARIYWRSEDRWK